MGLLRELRADLGRSEHAPHRTEFLCVTAGAIGNAVVAWIIAPGSPFEASLLAVAAAAFLVRGTGPRLPAEVFAALVIGPVWYVTSRPGAPAEGAFFMSVMMVLSVAANSGSRVRPAVIAVVGALYPWTVNLSQTPPDDIGWVAWTFAHIFTYVLGRVMRMLMDTIAELDRTRQVLADQAVAEERRRIARELHDLAGHTLAAVMLHVTGARHVLRRDPDEAEAALREAESVGRRSLDQIRATVGALRTAETGTDTPVESGADLVELVDEYRRAGLDVTADLGAASDLDGPVGFAVHRIAREALSNVARHAPGNRVRIRVEVGDAGVTLRIDDHGEAARPAGGSITFGLTGMRERARAVGGVVEAGPTSDGWTVRAELPLDGRPAPDRATAPADEVAP